MLSPSYSVFPVALLFRHCAGATIRCLQSSFPSLYPCYNLIVAQENPYFTPYKTPTLPVQNPYFTPTLPIQKKKEAVKNCLFISYCRKSSLITLYVAFEHNFRKSQSFWSKKIALNFLYTRQHIH